MTDTSTKTRQNKTPAQRAQDLFDAAQARLDRARTRRDGLKTKQAETGKELKAAETEVKAAETRRDFLAGDPDLPAAQRRDTYDDQPDTTTDKEPTE